MKKFKSLNNKGFSLVELIVTVLITSVLMIGVIAFLSTSRSAYQNVAVSSTLQEETITVKRIINEYLSEAKYYGYQSGITDITGSSGNVSVLWVVARDTESNLADDKSNFFVLDTGDNKLRFCSGDASLCPKNQIDLTDDAKTLIANSCFKSATEKKFSVIGEHVESMSKAGVAQRYDGTDLVAVKLVYRYPEGSGVAYNDEITVVTRNRLRATPTPTPKPTPTPLPPAPTGGGGGSTPTPTPTTEPTGGATATPSPTPSSTPTSVHVDLSDKVVSVTKSGDLKNNGTLQIKLGTLTNTTDDWEISVPINGSISSFSYYSGLDYRISVTQSGNSILIKSDPSANGTNGGWAISSNATLSFSCKLVYTGTLPGEPTPTPLPSNAAGSSVSGFTVLDPPVNGKTWRGTLNFNKPVTKVVIITDGSGGFNPPNGYSLSSGGTNKYVITMGNNGWETSLESFTLEGWDSASFIVIDSFE